MKIRGALLASAAPAAVLAVASSSGGCSAGGTAAPDGGGADASADASPGPDAAAWGAVDARASADDSGVDGGTDSPADSSAPYVTALSIASAYGTPLEGAPGDALPLVVVVTLSDGSTRAASPNDVTWTAPEMLVAEDPYDAGTDTVPEAGALPTAFFVRNDYRGSSPGTLYVTDRGTASSPAVTVTAMVADAGVVSATVTILAAPTGDPDAGGALFQHVLLCSDCHGTTGGGSPRALSPDGGPAFLDGGPAYLVGGQEYPYPAPGLNAAPGSGNVATDPAWSAGLFAMAAQSDMDNRGVALRKPMPMWLGGNNGSGAPLNAQNFADLYAWLKTQTR